ncbi:hypothetical protein KP77_10710 [Jeotgalibacillus alimentarius]|uniref:DUF4181 domain-containing protein n=1 Tax=Jeotgalibacillus alimentarius TaxID=135826 RepID=A0A0C2SC89_9BACL|nr:hypothetical protein KP77_10710 [Jeotgalibacillus alimentarius]
MILIAAIVTIIVAFSFRPMITRILGADRQKFFSRYNHVNKNHKILDWTIRGVAIILIIVLGWIQISMIRNGGEVKWYLATYTVLFAMFPLTELLRAYMEWKHADNRNNYKVTLSEIGFLACLTVVIFSTGFFGAFELNF